MKTNFGSHLSISGGMHLAAEQAHELGMTCVQIFTKNQRQWKTKPLTDETIDAWKRAVAEADLLTTVSHDSYLINLASNKEETREKSINLLTQEIDNCDALDIPYLVMHPGAHLGDGEDIGLERIAQNLDRVHEQLAEARTITCLEVTAGQGTNLGYQLEHLATIIDQVEQPDRLGVCLDTAHLIAAGYDLTSSKGMQSVIDEIDAVLTLDRIKVIHVNDSKVERGKRVDRHEHIAHGHVAPEAFGVLLADPVLGRLPMILETPKADAEDGRPWDLHNIETLTRLRDEALS